MALFWMILRLAILVLFWLVTDGQTTMTAYTTLAALRRMVKTV